MQTNEFVGQVKHGPRRRPVKQARTPLRETPETRTERQDVAVPSRLTTGPLTGNPRRYGAGF